MTLNKAKVSSKKELYLKINFFITIKFLNLRVVER